MRLKRIILLGLLITFLTGCNVEYNVNINKDLSVDESFNIMEDLSVLKSEKYNSVNEVTSSFQNKTTVNLKKYEYNSKIKNDSFVTDGKRQYGNIDTYVVAVNKIDLFSNETVLNKNNGVYTFTSKVNYEKNEELVAITHKIDARIGITVPFEVIDNNADEVDEGTNTYYWNLKNYVDPSNQKSIKLSFDTNKVIYTKNTMIKYVAIGVIIFGLIIAAIVIKKKSDNKGEL